MVCTHTHTHVSDSQSVLASVSTYGGGSDENAAQRSPFGEGTDKLNVYDSLDSTRVHTRTCAHTKKWQLANNGANLSCAVSCKLEVTEGAYFKLSSHTMIQCNVNRFLLLQCST